MRKKEHVRLLTIITTVALSTAAPASPWDAVLGKGAPAAHEAAGFSGKAKAVFLDGEDSPVSKGWGENGQCMMKMHLQSGEISVVMTNKYPGVDQAESGVEWLVDSYVWFL